MKCLKTHFVCAIGIALTVALAARSTAAQTVTTGTLSGVVADQQGGVLPGVTISATHTDTGTKYDAITQADGRFLIPNVRVGTYHVAAALSGFKTQSQEAVVRLGEDQSVELKLPIESLAETVTVTGISPVIDTARAGTAANVPREAIETLPTIARSIGDMARTSPFFNQTQDSAGNQQYISVAGRNFRYNNMQIDGAVNNDVFGLANSGTPGGQTETQPISFDAIQE